MNQEKSSARGTASFCLLTSSFQKRRVPPGECGFTSSDGDPGTNGVISKTRCGVRNEHYKLNFASGHSDRAKLRRADKFESLSTSAGFALPFDNLVRQLIGRYRGSRKMGGEYISNDCDRSADAFGEFVLAEAVVHCSHNTLPEFLAAFLVNRLIADHGKFMRAGRNENEYSVALASFMHPQSMKFSLRRDQWVCLQLAALDVNANLAGSF
jgi:hypothetical protein